jgi:hypothetical protein
MSKLILTDAAKGIATILLNYDDDEFHLIKYTDVKVALVNEFNEAIDNLEDLSIIEVERDNTPTFYAEGETPESSLRWEFSVKLLDYTIQKSL